MTERHGLYEITWDWPVFLSQLFGFGVIVLAVVKWVLPPARAAMARAQATIRTQLAESEQAKLELASAERALAESATGAPAAAERVRRDALAAADRVAARFAAQAADEADLVRRQGHDRVSRLRRELTRELESAMRTAVLDRTEHLVRQRLAAPSARAASIDRFLDTLDHRPSDSEEVRADLVMP
ncbi:hypothetical protein [Nocardia arthritidis]|uniref:ATP synthase subunit b n=1 Tax=Nocardia arthritidis TaxID=228602 RepID=A0A6G9Y8L7_9NOCA|nr:hypothetical protein [Nocardia arthritidis]QIS09562.1 hypothetical protein F5544_08300 [Nocardia arthritidis]